jgi:hypothetical protein
LNSRNASNAARGYFLIGCNRVIDDVPGQAARMVQIKRDHDVCQQKAFAGAPDTGECFGAIRGERAELREFYGRVKSCVGINATYDTSDGMQSARYDREICRLEVIAQDIGRMGDAAGLEAVVGMACDDIQFSREQAARDEAFRGQMLGILASGAQSLAGTVAHGTAQLDAAKHGMVLPDSEAASGGALAGGAAPCTDNGASCEYSGSVTAWKTKCSDPTTPNQGPCYCAAVATANCFIMHGCYAEAGAKTKVTRGILQQTASTSAANAAQYGTSCDSTPACVPQGGHCTDGMQCCSHACAGQGLGNRCQ